MVTKARLKEIEETAYYNEQKRLESKKKVYEKRTGQLKESASVFRAKQRGIAKTKEVPTIKESTAKKTTKKVGDFLVKTAKWGIEQRKKKIAAQKKREMTVKKAAATRKKNAIAKKKTKK